MVIPTLTEWPVLALYWSANVGKGSLRVFGRHVDERAEELVPAVSDHEVVRAHTFANGRDHLDEDAVTCGVTLGVIHVLEAVDVEEYHRDPLAADPARPVDLTLQGRQARAATECPGEVVGRRDLSSFGCTTPSREPVERRTQLCGIEWRAPRARARARSPSTLRVTSTERRRLFLSSGCSVQPTKSRVGVPGTTVSVGAGSAGSAGASAVGRSEAGAVSLICAITSLTDRIRLQVPSPPDYIPRYALWISGEAIRSPDGPESATDPVSST